MSDDDKPPFENQLSDELRARILAAMDRKIPSPPIQEIDFPDMITGSPADIHQRLLNRADQRKREEEARQREDERTEFAGLCASCGGRVTRTSAETLGSHYFNCSGCDFGGPSLSSSLEHCPSCDQSGVFVIDLETVRRRYCWFCSYKKDKPIPGY